MFPWTATYTLQLVAVLNQLFVQFSFATQVHLVHLLLGKSKKKTLLYSKTLHPFPRDTCFEMRQLEFANLSKMIAGKMLSPFVFLLPGTKIEL